MATFGNTTQETGGSESAIHQITGSTFTCPESGTADSITVYLDWDDMTGAQCAIYETDGTFVASTEEISDAGAGSGWRTLNFSGSPALTNQDYVLVVWAVGVAADIVHDNSTANGLQYDSQTYNSWPDPASFSDKTGLCSIYCTYTPGGGGEVKTFAGSSAGASSVDKAKLVGKFIFQGAAAGQSGGSGILNVESAGKPAILDGGIETGIETGIEGGIGI